MHIKHRPPNSFLLINPPITDSGHDNPGPRYFPLGLGIIAAVLEKKEYPVSVFDIQIEGLSKKDVTTRLKAILPKHDIVGISAIINSLAYVVWLCAEIKRIKPSITIILGGSICTSVLDLLATKTNCDIFCIGEGEKTIAEL